MHLHFQKDIHTCTIELIIMQKTCLLFECWIDRSDATDFCELLITLTKKKRGLSIVAKLGYN